MEKEKPKGRAYNQAVKLLIIRDYLYSHSNEKHRVKVPEIIEYLDKEYGIRADRKTIYTDIQRLQDDYGLQIEHCGAHGYYIKDKKFTPSELRLMVDSVQASNFITDKEAAAITKKIKDLADIYTRESLDRRAYVHERIQSMKESIVERTDDIHEAIRTDAKISFKYAKYMPSLSVEKKKNYSKKGEPYVVSPFALYWNNGNYYLCAYVSEWKKIGYFRIDRMEGISISDEQREGHTLFQAEELESRKAKVFGMFGGKTENVSLRANNKLANQIIDTFGSRVTLVPDGDKHFNVRVTVELSPTFYAWVSTFGKDMQITNPPEVVEGMKAFLDKARESYE